MGLGFPAVAASLSALPAAFVQLLQIVVGPLMLLTIALGIYESGRDGHAGRTAALGILGAFVLTAVALALGVGLAVLFRAGIDFHLDPGVSTAPPRVEFSWNALVPGNLAAALVRGDTTQLVGVGALMGFAMLRAGDAGGKLANASGTLLQVLFHLTAILVKVAPLAAFGATAALVAGSGVRALTHFIPLFVAVATGLAGLGLVLFPLLLRSRGVRALPLWRAVQQPVLIGFAAASGAAALPSAIDRLQHSGARNETVRVVYPLCAMLNATGSTLFMGCATVFIAQASGIVVTLAVAMQMFGALYALGKAIPSVPRGSIAIIASGVASLGVPAANVAAGIGLLLAVDMLFDMARTGVNVWGNCALVAAVDGRRCNGGSAA